MKFEIIDSKERLLEIKELWDDLYDRTKQKTIFQSFEWNYEWCEIDRDGHSLFILLYHKEKEPSAIFPFWIDKKGVVRFIADKHTDHCGFLIDLENGSDMYVMFKHTVSAILSSKKCAGIELKNISQHNPYIGIFSTFFDEKQMLFRSNATSSMKLVPGENFFQCFQRLNAKKKQVLKQLLKHNKHYISEIYSHDEPYPDKKIRDLAYDMIKRGERSEAFFSDDMLTLFGQMFQKGVLTVHEVRTESGETVAVNLLIRLEEDRYMFWIDLFKDIRKINVVSNLLFMKSLCESASRPVTLDYGRGIYEYKIKNFQPDIDIQLTFFHSKNMGLFLKFLFSYSTKLALMNFYKKHKSTINKMLRR